MNKFEWIIKNGNLTEKVSDCLGVLGILVIWATAYFFQDWSGLWFWLFMCFGAVVGYFGAYGGLAKKFGLRPFTNDPLGWRKAKATYSEPTEKTAIESEPGANAEKREP